MFNALLLSLQKKMKKLLLTLLPVLLITNITFAQEKYIRLGAGYGIPHSQSVRGLVNSAGLSTYVPLKGDYSIINNSNGYYSEDFNVKKASFSSGFQSVAAFGLMFNKNIGIEIAAGSILSPDKNVSKTVIQSDKDKVEISVIQSSKRPIFVTPSLVIQTGGKTNVYARLGVSIPVFSKLVQDIIYTDSRYDEAKLYYIINQYKMVEEYKMKMNVGIAGAAGVSFKLAQQVTLWTEAGFLSCSLFYKSSELTRFEQNGVSILHKVPSTVSNTTYSSNNITLGGDGDFTSQVPFSNINMLIGISFGL